MEMGERMKPKTVPSIFFEIYDRRISALAQSLTVGVAGSYIIDVGVVCLHRVDGRGTR